MSEAQDRRRVLRQVLQAGTANTQSELLAELEAHEFPTTQPVISRDLRAIGAVKSEGKYSLPTEERITRLQTLRALLRSAQMAGPHLVVVVCEPGAASAIARALEAEVDLDLLGTVAGDDTIFVAVAERAVGEQVCDLITSLV